MTRHIIATCGAIAFAGLTAAAQPPSSSPSQPANPSQRSASVIQFSDQFHVVTKSYAWLPPFVVPYWNVTVWVLPGTNPSSDRRWTVASPSA